MVQDGFKFLTTGGDSRCKVGISGVLQKERVYTRQAGLKGTSKSGGTLRGERSGAEPWLLRLRKR